MKRLRSYELRVTSYEKEPLAVRHSSLVTLGSDELRVTSYEKEPLAVRHSSLVTRHSSLHRGGVTLTEVLMSVLLTGFGVITLATLFPISVQRTIQATHLTHATILRYNAEAQLDIFPTLLSHPDGATDVTTFARNTSTGDAFVYVLDPLGARVMTAAPNTFGGARDRFDGGVGLTTEAAARAFVTLGGSPGVVGRSDSFTQEKEFSGDATPTSFSTTSVTLPAEVDLANVPFGTTTSAPSRIVLFSNTGRGSQTRTISDISGQVITWNTPLPGTFQVEKVRILTPESRYTWMMTVRNLAGGSGSQVTVVVFANRAFAPEDELVRQASFVQGSNQLNVNWTGPTKPSYLAGGYVFDIENGYWYMVQQVTNETAASATLQLEQPAFANSASAVFMKNVVEAYPIGTK
ncbi:MAG: hypothetical protein WD066_00035 [Planctomycetaceae bacterium]